MLRNLSASLFCFVFPSVAMTEDTFRVESQKRLYQTRENNRLKLGSITLKLASSLTVFFTVA